MATKGVRKHSQSNKWTATLWYNNKSHHIGSYETEAQAIYYQAKEVKRLAQLGIKTGKYNKGNYVDPIMLYREMVISKNMGILTNRLAQAFILIAQRTHLKFRYKNEADKYDCYSNGILIMMQNWHHFDEERYDNVLAYMTELFKRAVAFEWTHNIQKKAEHISIEGTFESGRLNI
jgi:hypothetical protein